MIQLCATCVNSPFMRIRQDPATPSGHISREHGHQFRDCILVGSPGRGPDDHVQPSIDLSRRDVRCAPEYELFTATPGRLKACALERAASWRRALVETIRSHAVTSRRWTASASTRKPCAPDAYRALRMFAAVGEKVIGHLPLPEQVPLLPEW